MRFRDAAAQPTVKKYFCSSDSSQSSQQSSQQTLHHCYCKLLRTRAYTFIICLDKWKEGGELKERADQALLELIAGANLPLSIVDHPNFKEFCSALTGGQYKPPSRRTVTERLDEFCASYEEKLKSELMQVVVLRWR